MPPNLLTELMNGGLRVPITLMKQVKDTGKGGALSEIGYQNLTQPKSYHLRKL